MVVGRTTGAGFLRREQRAQPLPLPIAQIARCHRVRTASAREALPRCPPGRHQRQQGKDQRVRSRQGEPGSDDKRRREDKRRRREKECPASPLQCPASPLLEGRNADQFAGGQTAERCRYQNRSQVRRAAKDRGGGNHSDDKEQRRERQAPDCHEACGNVAHGAPPTFVIHLCARSRTDRHGEEVDGPHLRA